MADSFRFDLAVTNVDEAFIVDPKVFVRVSNDARTVQDERTFPGEPVTVRFDDRPAGDVLVLRLTPSRYHDTRMFCMVDGDGQISPEPFSVPRRASEWLPAFVSWSGLGSGFDLLKKILGDSLAFRCGRDSEPGKFTESQYDAVRPVDESPSLAKMALLNLYSRLSVEAAPGTTTPWFTLVKELAYSTRERFVAEVEEECWTRVEALTRSPKGGYRGVKVVPAHIKNLQAVPGVVNVTHAVSVKTRESKANLQLTAARAERDGHRVFLLDTDMDENGRLILHAFDLIKHAFSGGTHPIEIAEALRALFPAGDLGYGLEPRHPIAETSGRVIG